MSRHLAALLLAVLGVLPAGAAPGAEQPASPARGPLTLYLVLRPEDSRNSMLVERMHLPSSIAALAWTGFKLEGSGNVELTAGGGYRLVSHQPASEESLGELGVYGYSVKVTWIAGSDQPPRKTYAFELKYEGTDGRGVALQPAQRQAERLGKGAGAGLPGRRQVPRQGGSALSPAHPTPFW